MVKKKNEQIRRMKVRIIKKKEAESKSQNKEEMLKIKKNEDEKRKPWGRKKI